MPAHWEGAGLGSEPQDSDMPGHPIHPRFYSFGPGTGLKGTEAVRSPTQCGVLLVRGGGRWGGHTARGRYEPCPRTCPLILTFTPSVYPHG